MSGALGTRGSRRRTFIAGSAALALGIVAVTAIVFWPHASASDATVPNESHHDLGSSTLLTTGTDEILAVDMSAAEVIEPPVADSAGNTPQTSLAEAAASEVGRSGADDLGQPRDDVDPSEVIDSESALGGCHEAYGQDGQCLPGIPPSQSQHAAEMEAAGLDAASMTHRWTCDEVVLYFPDGIAVRVSSVDPDGLDADLDGIACEPDD